MGIDNAGFGGGACTTLVDPLAWSGRDGPDGFISGFGLSVDNAGFGGGVCTTLVDPWSAPDGTELDDAWAFDDSECSSTALSNSSSRSSTAIPRFPNTISRLWPGVCAPNQRMLDVSLALT